jgi:hypothetical protein
VVHRAAESYLEAVPKECAHWIIARRAAASYTGPQVRSIVARWEPLYLLGSVLPDTAYYSPVGRWSGRLRELADTLHGERGGDPLYFLEGCGDGPAAALALGAAGHVMTDSQFHPIVYHLCGVRGVHKRALRRHLQLEGWLDVRYRAGEPAPFAGRLAAILAAASLLVDDVAALVRAVLRLDESLPRVAVAAALRRHAAVQRLFESGVLRDALSTAGRLAAPLADAAALLYPAAGAPAARLDGPIAYRDPVTGEPHDEPLAAVEARVIALVHKVFDACEAAAAGRAGAQPWAAVPRLSAETGHPPSTQPIARLMRHFGIARGEELLAALARGGRSVGRRP